MGLFRRLTHHKERKFVHRWEHNISIYSRAIGLPRNQTPLLVGATDPYRNERVDIGVPVPRGMQRIYRKFQRSRGRCIKD